MIRKHKKFSWPRKLYDKQRILEENKLVEKYGLKNKREIWKTEAKIKHFRNRTKSLITASQEEQNKFFDKLNKIGFDVKTIADVLALSKEDLLKRMLTNIVVSKGLANTPKQARQMIVHKRIAIDNKTVNVPSYLVKVTEENLISFKKKYKKLKIAKKKESKEIKNES
ncbi:MAG: 30S ribosomal protein S4 [Nanoarchaeota archaeon]|nr:30S ribosomal protein S4 [Nanoarchaeota archaeon]